MKRTLAAALLWTTFTSAHAGTLVGKVTTAGGAAIEGAMVSAFDAARRQSTSVFSQTDGSFTIDGLRDTTYRVRARLMGRRDEWLEAIRPDAEPLSIAMHPATGDALEEQRPASSGFSMLKFDDLRDKLNFKMMCSYCHQIGTLGFRTPEQPVDWETMIMRMDGFGGLYPHTKRTIVKRIIDTYKDDAVKKWPPFEPPPPPTGKATKAKITTWELGEPFEGSFHDLELGPDGLVYAVNISKHCLVTLDPASGEQKAYRFPRGSYAPHSVELGNDGHMWFTMCASGQMAKFDLDTREFLVCSSAESHEKRGSYPHTLRINPNDPEGLIWYTDAGRNSCFSLHPRTLRVKEYPLLKKNQAVAAGKGESRGITPYGLDYSPVDGMIWYSKLNGNRIGRIDPNAPDGDIKEWNPPFRGPRRLHVDQDGIVWVPGFASGVFAKFDPKSEEWTVYELPDAENQIPYALNVDPKGFVWICGTGNDTLNRFDPRSEELVEFRLPMRVSYTREIEFDSDGNVWTSTSGPARHMETGCGAVIKLEVLGDAAGGGVRLAGTRYPGAHSRSERVADTPREAPDAELLARIDRNELPEAYRRGREHQKYVDRRMAGMSKRQRRRVGDLWSQKVRIDPDMPNRGWCFVRIMEYVAENEGRPGGSRVHRLANDRRARFDAFVYANRIPESPGDGETPDAFAGRVLGRLANQEGRVLLKLPPGMSREAYLGFKTFLTASKSVAGGSGNCAACHVPAGFGDSRGAAKPSIPSLRNLARQGVDLEKAIRAKMARSELARAAAESDSAYAAMALDEDDIPRLVAFLRTLDDVPEHEFRDLILNATVLDTSGDLVRAPAVTGAVRFDGPRPKRRPLRMTPESRKLYKKTPLDENILIGREGGLANVFIHVKRGLEKKDWPVPDEPVVVNQVKSMFRPRVQGIRVGQPFVMRNSDPHVHNIRSLSLKNRAFNVAQPADTPDRSKVFRRREGPVAIKCDFHKWMEAHLFVMDHPFFAVSDARGRFRIEGLPPGRYTLEAWHEEFGERELEITVDANGAAQAGFTFRAVKAD